MEVVSGEQFDAYLEEHIFTPLGMEDTTSVLTASDRPGLDAGSVSMYGFALPLRELRASVGGAGGVISTAEDLGAWLSMKQQGGVAPNGVRLLSADLVEQSHEKQPGTGTYALGWQHTSTADPPRIGHDGALTRYAARQDLVPSSGLATAVLLTPSPRRTPTPSRSAPASSTSAWDACPRWAAPRRRSSTSSCSR
ncbi:Beta-lactamase [Serinicoccus hydrothermalis]|uniref:Beta-lactamase n=1 Tax=Serinicoccus hydrothermalis TaxID=1758689 RepID=A0A1B1NB59_9MICO|nr:Beta-lactamase [Serinicoccus hydrothermalis]